MSASPHLDDGAVYAVVGVTLDESVSAGMLMVRRQYGRQLVGVGVVFGVTALLMFSIGQYAAGLGFAAYGALLCSGIVHRSAYRKRYRNDPRAGEMVQFRFAPDGFAMAGSGFESRYSWYRILKVYENAHIFMLMISKDRGVPIPKRCLAPGDDARLRAFAMNAVHFS